MGLNRTFEVLKAEGQRHYGYHRRGLNRTFEVLKVVAAVLRGRDEEESKSHL